MDNEFSRLQTLVGEEALNKLKAAHVAVFGIGGVGGYVAEALARSGISNLDLIDKDEFDFSQYDYVVDAVDTVTAKLALIEQAKKCGTPIICSMGAGNKLDPAAFEVADISKTSVCPLARVMRQECKKRGFTDVKVVYSKEKPVLKTEVPASCAFVPSAAGLIIASEVVKDLINK